MIHEKYEQIKFSPYIRKSTALLCKKSSPKTGCPINWNLRISTCHQSPRAAFRTCKPPSPTRIFFISIPWPTVILRRVKITFEHDALVKLFI